MLFLDRTLKVDAQHFCSETIPECCFLDVLFWNNFSKCPRHADVTVLFRNFHNANHCIFSQRNLLVKMCKKAFNVGGWLFMEAIA
jgi:hypothetical protein